MGESSGSDAGAWHSKKRLCHAINALIDQSRQVASGLRSQIDSLCWAFNDGPVTELVFEMYHEVDSPCHDRFPYINGDLQCAKGKHVTVLQLKPNQNSPFHWQHTVSK